MAVNIDPHTIKYPENPITSAGEIGVSTNNSRS